MSNETTGRDRSSWSRDTELKPVVVPGVVDTEGNTVKYLQSNRIDRISIELKDKCLDIFKQTGNLSESARLVGVNPKSIRWHLDNDPEFKAAYTQILNEITDQAEGTVRVNMLRPQGVIDRMAWLRARRPEVWNPQPNNQPTINGEIVIRLAKQAEQYVDATIVPNEPKPGLPTQSTRPKEGA